MQFFSSTVQPASPPVHIYPGSARRLQFVTNILHSFVIGLTSKCNGRAEAFEHRLVAAGIHAA
jgi:hypothetical protein